MKVQKFLMGLYGQKKSSIVYQGAVHLTGKSGVSILYIDGQCTPSTVHTW